MDKFKKQLENIWFYYKVPIIVGIIVIYVLSVTVIQKAKTIKYDYSIGIISLENYPSEENVLKIKNIFEDKLNGSCEIVIYNVALGETGQDESIISKLDLDLRNNISCIFFIEDMEAFKKTTANIEFKEVVLVKDVDWLNNLGLDNFYYATRK